MKLYKIRHKPTGLFFEPKYFGGGDWVKKKTRRKGKFYEKKPKLEQSLSVGLGNGYTKIEDWEIIEVEVK
jgi:hypothetical protein